MENKQTTLNQLISKLQETYDYRRERMAKAVARRNRQFILDVDDIDELATWNACVSSQINDDDEPQRGYIPADFDVHKCPVKCLHPRLLLNPVFMSALRQCKRVTILHYAAGGLRKHTLLFNHPYKVNVARWLPKFVRPSHSDILNNVYMFRADGVDKPLYTYVPCNHCVCCMQSRRNHMATRCLLESQSYSRWPMFFTLTYDPRHKPADGLSKRDCQLFLHRLRKYLAKCGLGSFRYVLVGEYGSKTLRPHYHAIVWFTASPVELTPSDATTLVRLAWMNGNIWSRVINMSTGNDAAFMYTFKYAFKGSVFPKDMNKPFMLSSHGNGGIGSKFLDDNSDDFRDCINHGCDELLYCNRFKGKVEKLTLSSYILNRLLPSKCRSFSSNLRKDINDISSILGGYSVSDVYMDKYENIKSIFGSYIHVPGIPFSRKCAQYSASVPVFKDEKVDRYILLDECLHRVQHFIDKFRARFDEFLRLDELRNMYLSSLEQKFYDVSMLSSICEKSLAYKSPACVF